MMNTFDVVIIAIGMGAISYLLWSDIDELRNRIEQLEEEIKKLKGEK